MAEVDLDARVVRYAGVGNIAGTVLAEGVSPQHGVAQRHRRPRGAQVPGVHLSLPDGGDAGHALRRPGVRAGTSTPTRAWLAQDPALIAGVLYRDFQRGRDDVTVLVARPAGEAGA